METNKVKRCYKCGRVLPIEQFYKNRSMPDGLQTACKDCIKERDKERQNRRKATKIEKFTSRELMEELARRGYRGKLEFIEVHTIDITNF